MVTETEQHVALPKLYGAPAYARPPKPVVPIERPLDVDDLPLEAERSADERVLATDVLGAPWGLEEGPDGHPIHQVGPAAHGAPAAGEYVRPLAFGAAGGTRSHGLAADGSVGLQARPFRLRSLATRLLSGR